MTEVTQERRPNIFRDERCTFCLSAIPRGSVRSSHADRAKVPCVCCGTYWISGPAMDASPHWDLSEAQWAAIAYQIRRMTGRAEPPLLSIEVLRSLKETARLPDPAQILEDFVLWVGSHSRWGGERFNLSIKEHRTLLGAVDKDAFDYMIEMLAKSDLFTGLAVESVDQPRRYLDCALAPSGWKLFRELTHSHVGQRYGFMAMKYDDPQVDAVVRDHFVPQVKLAGFDLVRLDQGQPAGLIDDQLRLRIRQARFLVCDLTHGNRGAYWEAGFAEGLGVPVIYTCREDVFKDTKHECHPHFDAAHWVTVPWKPEDPAPAAAKLKVTVRATLPAEARLED
jgi:hypothetical protein